MTSDSCLKERKEKRRVGGEESFPVVRKDVLRQGRLGDLLGDFIADAKRP